MTKVLCWQEKDNGKYCKNYLLHNKNKCYVHYEHNNDLFFNLLTRFIVTCMLTYFTYNIYIDNKDYFDVTFNIYAKQLYKIDSNQASQLFLLHIKNAWLLVTKYLILLNTYISKYI